MPEYITQEKVLESGKYELNEVEILKLIPEMQALTERLRSLDTTKINPDQARAYEEDLVHLIGWTDAAFNYDNDHGTNWRSKVDISMDEINDLGSQIAKYL
jgi:hypothetical protein